MAGKFLAVVWSGLCFAAGCSPQPQSPAANEIAEVDEIVSNESLRQAEVFIRTHMDGTIKTIDGQTKSGSPETTIYTLTPSNLVVGNEEWSWTAKSSMVVSGDGVKIATLQEDNVKLQPSSMSLPIKVEGKNGFSNVQLECLVGKCITITGWLEIKSEPEALMVPRRESNERVTEQVTIEFDSLEEAQRVAKAMTVLLEAAGAKERRF